MALLARSRLHRVFNSDVREIGVRLEFWSGVKVEVTGRDDGGALGISMLLPWCMTSGSKSEPTAGRGWDCLYKGVILWFLSMGHAAAGLLGKFTTGLLSQATVVLQDGSVFLNNSSSSNGN